MVFFISGGVTSKKINDMRNTNITYLPVNLSIVLHITYILGGLYVLSR